MKKYVLLVLSVLIALTLVACQKPNVTSTSDLLHDDERNQDYSNNMLIISIEAGTEAEMLEKILKKYNLTVLNEMPRFSMYTVKTHKAMTTKELDSLIQDLEKESKVLGVEKNYISSPQN